VSKLSEMIAGVLALDPGADALEFAGIWRSWGDLDSAAAAIEDVLDRQGLGAGARVAVLLKNRPAFIAAVIALVRSGRCLVTLNGSAPPDRLAEDIARVEAPVIMADADSWSHAAIETAIRSSGGRGYLLQDDVTEPLVARTSPGLPSTRDFAPDVAIEMLTSGTTGTPKRIPLAARNLEKALLSAAAYEKGRSEDDAPRLRSGVQIVTAPLAHIAGITAVMNNVLAGRKICLIEKFTVEAFRDAVVRYRPKVAGAPPAALRMIMDANVPREDLSSLLAYRTGTAPLDPALADAFYERYGIPVLQNYGATEFSGGAAGWTLGDFKVHWSEKKASVGRLNPGVEGRIVAADGSGDAGLPTGSEGLLELRGPNIADGKTWVRTTDLAVLDADNFLYIRGRADNAIIRGGFKIMPDDVIKAMEAHPAVLEVGVVALADRRLGQVPAAGYKVRAGHVAPDDAAFKAWLRERLLPYQVPVVLLAVEDFPRTPSMKIAQPALKALLEAAAGAEASVS
jgi:long-chain acyl-CoA synthetase